MDFVIGIASYKRPDNQRTLAYLERLGIDRERIILSVQTFDDLEAYKRAGIAKRVSKILYREARNASGNRNTILDNLPAGKKVLLLDDDITEISRLSGGALMPIETAEDFARMAKAGFSLAAKHHTAGFGVYPVHNAFFMKNQYRKRNIVDATLMGIINTDQRFNENTDTKEDFEFCCDIMRRYGNFIRMDNFACKAQHHSKGGCEEFWKDEAAKEATAINLARRYPDIIELNPKRRGEIKMKKRGKD